jgi:cytochrome c556
MRKLLMLVSLAVLFASSAALALDSSTIRDIERADSMKELLSEAEDIAKDTTFSTPADAEEAKLKAIEFQAYMSYIAVRQNALIAMELEKLKAAK